jgi:putative membrane protein
MMPAGIKNQRIKNMNFIASMLKGMIIGLGCIAPGFSGGAIAVVFGLYDKLIDAIAHFYIDFKKKFFFLLPYAIGGAVSVLLFSKVLTFLFGHYEIITLCALIGLMLGSLPSVYEETMSHGFKKRYILYFAFALILTVLFAVLNGNVSGSGRYAPDSWPMLFLAGIIIAFGTIIPGISASFILMYLGLYNTLLSIMDSLDIIRMIPVGLGAVISALLFSKAISYAYRKAAGAISFAVFGLLCGSVLSVFPPLPLDKPQTWTAIGLMVLCAGASFAGINLQKKYSSGKNNPKKQ